MTITSINSEEDYKIAILLLETLGDTPDFEEDDALMDEFEALLRLIEDYEAENYPIGEGKPDEIIKLKDAYKP